LELWFFHSLLNIIFPQNVSTSSSGFEWRGRIGAIILPGSAADEARGAVEQHAGPKGGGSGHERTEVQVFSSLDIGHKTSIDPRFSNAQESPLTPLLLA
jgi:hypothetical protein